MTDTDLRACAECGIVEWEEDLHNDGENDPTCDDCFHAALQASMRDALRGWNPRYAAEARWYEREGKYFL